ncbi:hypothetical protein Ahy_B05g076784 [Arachis hypogaea]|uniref:Uncharacterized protein n=1 Tax=Arachis hypogaea TaxID=3818 RepID=A0A444Z414_ARAHY|nr:hypothetical protein Ahy_B05g076784 [Arachis hypogaea]
MERKDEDTTRERRRLFRRALWSLLGSIEAAAAARACRAPVLTFGFYDLLPVRVSSVPFSTPRVRMQFSPLKSSAAISPDLFFRVNSSIRMALHGCYCHHIKLTNHRRTPNSFSFSSYISNPKFPKNKRGQRDSSENDAYPRFLVVMRQTELPASN